MHDTENIEAIITVSKSLPFDCFFPEGEWGTRGRKCEVWTNEKFKVFQWEARVTRSIGLNFIYHRNCSFNSISGVKRQRFLRTWIKLYSRFSSVLSSYCGSLNLKWYLLGTWINYGSVDDLSVLQLGIGIVMVLHCKIMPKTYWQEQGFSFSGINKNNVLTKLIAVYDLQGKAQESSFWIVHFFKTKQLNKWVIRLLFGWQGNIIPISVSKGNHSYFTSNGNSHAKHCSRIYILHCLGFEVLPIRNWYLPQ